MHTNLSTIQTLLSPWKRNIGFVVGYIINFYLIRLIFLSLGVFVFLYGQQHPLDANLQRLGDVIHVENVFTYGLSAIFFTILLHLLQPVTHTSLQTIFGNPPIFSFFRQLHFQRIALQGLTLSLVLLTICTWSTLTQYLGIYIQFDELFISTVTVLLCGLFHFSMILVEEYLLRECVERPFLRHSNTMLALFFSSATCLVIRSIQFQLDALQIFNLLLLNGVCHLLSRREGTFMASALFVGGLIVPLHSIFGLPFMGTDTVGFFLFRAADTPNAVHQFFAGGTAGPEGGFVFSLLLLVYLFFEKLRRPVDRTSKI